MFLHKELIHSYFKANKEKFEQNFTIVVHSPDEEVIHDMRVSIKRLRLLYKLLNSISYGKFKIKKTLKLLLKIFKSAAKLRDTQIQIALLYKIEKELHIDLSELIAKHQKKEQQETERMKQKLLSVKYSKIAKQFEKSENKIKQLSDNESLNSEFRLFFNNKLRKINQELSRQVNNYHKTRKRIKDLSYLFEIKYFNSEVPNELVALKKMGNLLGYWHDIDILINTVHFENQEIIQAYLKEKQQKLIEEFNALYSTFSSNIQKKD